MVYDVHAARYPSKRFRRVTQVRCWLDGVEVTTRCFYADVRRGCVRLYRLNAEGRKYVERPWFEHWNPPAHLRSCVATEERRGLVVVRKALYVRET